MTHLRLNPDSPPVLSHDERVRLERLTEAERLRAALSDPDNPPLSEGELARVRAAQRARQTRARTG